MFLGSTWIVDSWIKVEVRVGVEVEVEVKVEVEVGVEFEFQVEVEVGVLRCNIQGVSGSLSKCLSLLLRLQSKY